MNFKGKDCVSHVLQCLAGIHERVDNSCTQRAECPRRSFVIVHTGHGQGQAPFIREKSAYLAEVGVTIDNRATKRDWKRAKNLRANVGKTPMTSRQILVSGVSVRRRGNYSEVLFKALILLVKILYTTVHAYTSLP